MTPVDERRGGLSSRPPRGPFSLASATRRDCDGALVPLGAVHRAQHSPVDVELSRRLRSFGRIRTVRSSVRVSGRRFQARPFTYPILMNVFPLLYSLGVSPQMLARLYGDPR